MSPHDIGSWSAALLIATVAAAAVLVLLIGVTALACWAWKGLRA